MMIKSTLAPLASIAIAISGCSSPAKVSLGHGELTGAGGGAARDAGTQHASAGAMTMSVDAGDGPITPCSAIDTSGGVASADIYVMLDQSSSMGDSYPIASLGSWWDVARRAFTSIAEDPELTGAAMGLQYFPLGGIAPASCYGQYDTPEVELAPLPGNAGALTMSLAAHDPTAFTPTGPALTGAIRHMKDWAPTHPGRTPLVLLVTDGFPTECNPQEIDQIASMAREARDTLPAIRVGVIGLNLGAGGTNLDAIAKGGGTGSARLIDGGDAEAQLKSAIRSIVTSPVSCD